MDFHSFVAGTKIFALLLFVGVYTWACFWAFTGKKSQLERYSQIPFMDD